MKREEIVNAVFDSSELIIKDIAEMITDFTYGREIFLDYCDSCVIFPNDRIVIIKGTDLFHNLIRHSIFLIKRSAHELYLDIDSIIFKNTKYNIYTHANTKLSCRVRIRFSKGGPENWNFSGVVELC